MTHVLRKIWGRLEIELDRELHGAGLIAGRARGCGYGAQIGVRDVCVGSSEVWMIEYVERVGPELYVVALAPGGVFLQAHIPVLEGRTAQHVVLRVTVCGVCRGAGSTVDGGTSSGLDGVVARGRRECGRIQPLRAALARCIGLRTNDVIGTTTYLTYR